MKPVEHVFGNVRGVRYPGNGVSTYVPLSTMDAQCGRTWGGLFCTRDAGHLGKPCVAHGLQGRMLAKWDYAPGLDEALQAAAEADAMMTVASIDATKSLALTSLDQAQTTKDPQWFVAVEHYIRALHALALVGTRAGVEDEDGSEE